ncbi:hypothetical protein FRB90_012113 [Tulasnella sp. 427]|nr:hypothetical protein FRB90_012113 [Tulasnella sp. 427]
MEHYDSFDAQHGGGDANQGAAATSFPPIVRPTPSYHHAAFAAIRSYGNNVSDPRTSQTALYNPESFAYTPGMIDTWGGAPFDAQVGSNYDYGAAADRAIEASLYNQPMNQNFGLDERAGGLSSSASASNLQAVPPPSRLASSYLPISTSSPNILGNYQQQQQHYHPQQQQQQQQLSIPLNSSQPSSTSASPASTNSRHGYTIDPKPQSTLSAIAPFNKPSPVSASSATTSEPNDNPWNLVSYNLPFTASGRSTAGVPGDLIGGSTVGPGTDTPGAPLFLRSPTPTKRQRTSQACEKCRDRKAKVSVPSVSWILPSLHTNSLCVTLLSPPSLTSVLGLTSDPFTLPSLPFGHILLRGFVFRFPQCNGARPTCHRCQTRGLLCEYAKERRIRGSNRPGNGGGIGGNSPTEGVRQRIASSPARTSVANLVVPVHISGGQGFTPPSTAAGNGNGSGTGTANANALRASPPPGIAHHRKQLSTRLSPSPKVSGNQPLPVYRTLHVAQSHPELHSSYYSRPRSHTTPYPLAVNIPTHPSPLYQTMRSSARTDLSASDLSEPPSATSSNFGSDLVTFGHIVDVKPEPFALAMRMGGAGDLGQSIGVLGLSHGTSESDDPLHHRLITPHHHVVVKREVLDGVYIGGAGNGSPESYHTSVDVGNAVPGEEGDSLAAPASVWQDRFGISISTSGLLATGGLSAVSTGSASVSSGPSTSSPGPAGYRSHASAHSGGSIQETMSWNYGSNDRSYASSSSPTQTGSQMPIDSQSVNFISTSPKSESLSFTASSSMGNLTSHINYPWNVDQNLDMSTTFPRISAPDQSGVLSPTENDFRNWIDVDGNESKSGVDAAIDGSPIETTSSNSIRAASVLEVRE